MLKQNTQKVSMAMAAGMILLAAVTRIIPHAPNWTAVTAMAIFAGALFENRWLAALIPVIALALTDLILQSTGGVVFVYLPFVLITLGSPLYLQGDFNLHVERPSGKSWSKLAAGSVVASLFFFVVSNFGVWLESGMYLRTPQGLMTCYMMALPFLANQVVGDLFFSALMFGVFYLLKSSVVDSSRAL